MNWTLDLSMAHSPKGLMIASLAVAALCAGCGSSPPTPDLGVQAPRGYQVEPYATGLEGPTQMIDGPDGRLWVAQLAGPESAGTGQILALDRDDTAKRTILLEDLFKPTGIAVLNGSLWIAAGRDLRRADLDPEGLPGPTMTVMEALPSNGRSNGMLSVSPDGRLIYETSGTRRGNLAAEGSASLWSLDPADPVDPQIIASGMKNAFAHVFDDQGRLWATDVADDPVNGGPPPDELNLIIPGADYGWPACFGDREPAANYGGSETLCHETQPAVAVFPPHATPTGVVASPWEVDVLLVALWGPSDPSVVRVHTVEGGGRISADQVSPFLTGLPHPQSLLVLQDGSLLVSEFESGRVYRIWRP